MKKPKLIKEIGGLLAVLSAMALCISFLVQAVRRKSVWQALLAVLAASGTALAVLELLPKEESHEAVACEEELFEGEECAEAELRLHSLA